MKIVFIGRSVDNSPSKSINLNDLKDAEGNNLELPPDPQNNLVFDPRPIGRRGRGEGKPLDLIGGTFDIEVQVRRLVVTRTDENRGWRHCLFFRVYDRTKEDVPPFDSSLPYEYRGLYEERAPYDATVVKVHHTATIIWEEAFMYCEKMTTCDMSGAPVEEIEQEAFSGCTSLRNVTFSNSLKKIKCSAFWNCSALDVLVIPPTVTTIITGAFEACTNMRILKLPDSIDLHGVFEYDKYNYHFGINRSCAALEAKVPPNKELEQWIKDRYDQYPLHKVCYNANVTIEDIQHCIRDHPNAAHLTDEFNMTALHMITIMACRSNLQTSNGSDDEDQDQDQDKLRGIITLTSADTALITACFRANMSAAFVKDDRGKTPLDYLLECSNGLDVRTGLVASLCMHRNTSSELGASSSSSSSSASHHQHKAFKRMRYN